MASGQHPAAASADAASAAPAPVGAAASPAAAAAPAAASLWHNRAAPALAQQTDAGQVCGATAAVPSLWHPARSHLGAAAAADHTVEHTRL